MAVDADGAQVGRTEPAQAASLVHMLRSRVVPAESCDTAV